MLISRHATSAQHYQLGEGVLLSGVSPSAILGATDRAGTIRRLLQQDSHVIGATKEGCIFHAAPDMLHTEARGKRTPAVGTVFPAMWRATLTGVMLEATNRNFGRLLNQPAENGDATELFIPTDAPGAPVADTLLWIGSCGGSLLMIEMRHPISTGGLMLRSGWRGVGEMPFAFLALQGLEETTLPFRIHTVKEAIA